MREYLKHLDYYSSEYYLLYSKYVPASLWGNKKIAEVYLDKYWLPEAEYKNFWKLIQNQIFLNQKQGLPAILFTKNYDLLALRGGVLFVEKRFKLLQECMRKTGDKYFVIIENSFGGKLKKPAFRMKYPINITWAELMSGNYISSVLFEMFHNEYFVFGDTGDWGKYVANDYERPLDIIGFKKEHEATFRKYFKVSKKEHQEIRENWLPVSYKKYIQ